MLPINPLEVFILGKDSSESPYSLHIGKYFHTITSCADRELPVNEIESVISVSHKEFSNYVREHSWHGREREAVSLYALGFLQNQVGKADWLTDPMQISVEGAVRQRPGNRQKKHVNKDLLLWKKPAMTCWDSTWEAVHVPLAVLEWKVHRRSSSKQVSFSDHDLDWLSWYTSSNAGRIGFAISLTILEAGSTLRAAKIMGGDIDENWLSY